VKDVAPSLFLMAAGLYLFWTTRNPEHANPRFARFIGGGLFMFGTAALAWSLLVGV
jgi:hypothetical protein